MGAQRHQREPGADAQQEEQREHVKKMVLALYIRAGPSSMRTAFRSLVMRAMMSPVR